MTYQPQKGDRVRVVLEGAHSPYLGPEGSFVGKSIVRTEDVISIEKVAPPLPTTPESVVRNRKDGAVRILGRDRKWRDSAGFCFDTLGEPLGYDLIFDAGKAS